jgi:outer membrane protein assembly factor BamB
VVCLDALSGKLLWEQKSAGESYRTHNRNSLATSTPAVDAAHVYSCWAGPRHFKVLAHDHQGQLAWEADLGRYKSQHGFGTSPIVVGDLVIVANEPDGDGLLVALDCRDGKVRWQLPRQGKNATYSTPCLFQPKQGSPEIIFTNWQHGITAVDAANGSLKWEISVFEPNKSERAIASPFVAGDLVLGTCGFVTSQKHLVAVRPGDKSSGREAEEVWRLERAVSHMGTPLYRDGRIYQISEQGIATCLDSKTGKVIWQERLGDSFAASPILVGDNLYCPANGGDVYVLAAKDTYELVAKNPLGGLTQSTPAVAHNRLYFRTTRQVIAIEGGK